MAPLPYWPSRRTTAWLSGKDRAFTYATLHLDRPPQLPAVVAVACPRKRAHPLVGMGLQHGGARSDHFAPFAPKIAGSADLLQPALHGGEIRRAWQSALAGGLSRAIHIEDQGVCSLAIPQPTRLLLFHQRASQEILQKERAQSLDRGLVEGRQKAGERRAMRQALGCGQSHVGVGERRQARIERFQRPFGRGGLPTRP